MAEILVTQGLQTNNPIQRNQCQVLQRDPSDAQTYVSRGLLHQEMGEMGEMGEAIADLKQAAESLNQQGATADYQQILRIIERMLPGAVALG